ncbi:hypothetical protein HPT27_17220 [Permianibacter sp. IMCC34836]|uniref:Ig-like domain-containing protein n=1 Tax=Permianibacter fluminis TaxID=2738515 RepID=UPI0015516AA0|nr:Ig-like domain-containing protein [Permianibacter fluminis]NQD38761.1 hypothetical protein [Permianibacter fluminis]
MMSEWLKKGWAVLLAATLLAGCGGTGTSDEETDTGGGGSTATTAVAVQILDPSGNVTTNVTPSSPGTIRATVTNNGSAVANTVVTFSTTLGSLNPPSGTALTNASGVATITLNAGTVAGAGTVTASATAGNSTGQGTAAFSTTIPANNVTMTVTTPGGIVSAGGTTTVTAAFTNSDGSSFTTTVPVTFTSACVTSGGAVISSPVDSVGGAATATYRATGCVGADTVNVSAQVGGNVLSGTAVVTVGAAALGSIEFVSATPANIALQGTGDSSRPETSTVIFRVLDAQGNPLAGIPVTFALDTTVGGIARSPATAQTDAQGRAQTVVNAGTVATSVRVSATATQGGTSFSTTSSRLVVSTGLPDQDSISISASVLNPESWELDGKTVTVTARLADAFNNPVPNGTAVQFRAEGGAIDPSCTTTDGECTVTWRSQAPRPVGQGDLGMVCATVPELVNSCGQPYGGRVTILATAIGTESFPDINGNGRFDSTEDATFQTGTDVQGGDYDVPEAFVDNNEDGGYRISAGTDDDAETFVDFDNDQAYDADDNLYNGVLCGSATTCSTQKTLHVRDSLVIVMSSNDIYNRNMDSTGTVEDNTAISVPPASNVKTRQVLLADFHNQPIPAGSTIKIETSNGSILGTSTYTMPSTNSNGGKLFAYTVKGDTTSSAGSITFTVTTPSGVVNVLSGPSVND